MNKGDIIIFDPYGELKKLKKEIDMKKGGADGEKRNQH